MNVSFNLKAYWRSFPESGHFGAFKGSVMKGARLLLKTWLLLTTWTLLKSTWVGRQTPNFPVGRRQSTYTPSRLCGISTLDIFGPRIECHPFCSTFLSCFLKSSWSQQNTAVSGKPSLSFIIPGWMLVMPPYQCS